jgi:hypothetical protein
VNVGLVGHLPLPAPLGQLAMRFGRVGSGAAAAQVLGCRFILRHDALDELTVEQHLGAFGRADRVVTVVGAGDCRADDFAAVFQFVNVGARAHRRCMHQKADDYGGNSLEHA